SAAALSPDGKALAVGCSEPDPRGENKVQGWARILDLETGKDRCDPLPHRGPVYAVAFHPDGNSLLTGSEDATAQLWDLLTGRPRWAPLPHADPVQAVAFSPDGGTLFTGTGRLAQTRGVGRLWDASTGRPVGTPFWHKGMVRAAGFSRDGKHLISVS